jgi:hypothetical protein
MMLLEPHLMGEQLTEEVIHGERFNSSSHRSDKEVIFGTQAREEIRGELLIVQQLTGSGNLLKTVEIIGDRGISFLHNGKLIVEVKVHSRVDHRS